MKTQSKMPMVFDKIIWEAAFLKLGNSLTVNRQSLAESRRKTACGFSAFDFIAPSENVLSDILANLLDPNATHGQKDLFVHSLLAQVAPSEIPGRIEPILVREALTYTIPNNLRRIDIVATFPQFTLAIETKKFAKEQKNQIADYCDHLERISSGRFCLVFLTRFGEMPESIPRERADALINAGKIVLLSWNPGVAGWINTCLSEGPAPKIRHFLEDFQTYIDAYLATQPEEEPYAEEPTR